MARPQRETHRALWEQTASPCPAKGLLGEGDPVLWFWGPPDSHVMLVTCELSGEAVGQVWPASPNHLSVFRPQDALVVETVFIVSVPSCLKDRSSLILIPVLAISPPASFQPMALRTDFCLCH